MALEALKLVSKFLPVAYNEPNDISARAGMLVGSCLAGVSFLKGSWACALNITYDRC